jgi:hypothetical protein
MIHKYYFESITRHQKLKKLFGNKIKAVLGHNGPLSIIIDKSHYIIHEHTFFK